MKNTDFIPTVALKQMQLDCFVWFFGENRNTFGVSTWTKYAFGLSHDGFTIWNESSNSIGNDELRLISQFCDARLFSFSCVTRKTDNPSGYGGVMIEINICG